jgi:hypothetical protein
MSRSGTKPTRNTNLLKAMGLDSPSGREFWGRMYEEDPWQRQMHISGLMKDHSPFRARGWGGHMGWSQFKITADDRSYTILTVADDPAEWLLWGTHAFRSMMETRLHDIEYHHLMRQAEKDRAAWLADH